MIIQPFPHHHGRGQEHGEPGAITRRCPSPGPGLLRFLRRRRLRAWTAPPAPRPAAAGSLSCGPRRSPQPRKHRDADRAPPGSAAAAATAAAPKGPAASCKGPALRPRRPALQSHPGARGPSGAAPASHQLRLRLRGRQRGSLRTVTPSDLSPCG